ncbi:MAG: hypothetical protein ACRDD7_18010 [Peptostreptococcaceae bacterium]
MKLKFRLWTRYNKPLTHVTKPVISWYRRLCNRGMDNKEMAWLKLQRINDCGKIVHRFEDDNDHYIVKYWDMFLEVNNCIGVKIWRDRKEPVYKPDYRKYVKWNKKNGLESKREW